MPCPTWCGPWASTSARTRAARDTPGRVRAGIRLYDLLSNAFSRYRNLPHRFLTPAQLAAREPAVRTEGLLMAGLYYDALVDDARLVLETLKEARDASGGRSVALNYVRAVRLSALDGGGLEVELEDRPRAVRASGPGTAAC